MRRKSAALTLDGSGNGVASIAVPTSALKGVYVGLGTATSVPFTVTSLARNIVAATAVADKFFPLSELIAKADATPAASYDQAGALIHDTVAITVASGTAGGTVTFAIFYN